MSADLPAIKRGRCLRVILDKPLDVPKQTPREESKEEEAGLAIYRDTSADQPSITNVGPEMPLDSLADEYPNNPYLRRQILEWLPAHGPIRGWRRIRGDGNCYYRSFIVGVLDGSAGM